MNFTVMLEEKTKLYVVSFTMSHKAGVWSVRGDHLWFGFFPCFCCVGPACRGCRLGRSSLSLPCLPCCWAPADLLKSHGISRAVRGSQLKMKTGWWQGVFPSNCQARYRGLKKDCSINMGKYPDT